MRSTRPSTLHDDRRDLVRCAQDFDIDLAAPPSERLIIQYYIDEGSLGKLSISGGKLSAIDNPNNKMALGDVACSVICDGGIPLVDALAAFLCAKRKISIYLRDQLGECVYVSPSFEALHFGNVAILQKDNDSNIPDYFRNTGTDVHFLYDFICSHLNVIRLPLKHGTRWLLTLIPRSILTFFSDVVGAFNDDDAGSRAARTEAAAASSNAALGRGMQTRRPALDSAKWLK
jgi:hypothetical protein